MTTEAVKRVFWSEAYSQGVRAVSMFRFPSGGIGSSPLQA